MKEVEVEEGEITALKVDITALRSKVSDLEDILRSVKTELGSILDTLIELLPRQNPNYIQEYALLMTRVRELIKDIEKYV